ncbi:hypothetical protein AVEN_18141-1 [Araneus ventricosus]|uniref:Uncharacterized protein n=1 Tax=Araneus ventricosus TaxID=182803 RepID=A0A4Y2AI85_ARAVE|nr:hypothetical protein AVEN_18141-1 [Araneus ventricosus]
MVFLSNWKQRHGCKMKASVSEDHGFMTLHPKMSVYIVRSIHFDHLYGPGACRITRRVSKVLGLVWHGSLEIAVRAQAPTSSSEHGLKLRVPPQNGSRVASKVTLM